MRLSRHEIEEIIDESISEFVGGFNAIKKGQEQESNQREHCRDGESRPSAETSNSRKSVAGQKSRCKDTKKGQEMSWYQVSDREWINLGHYAKLLVFDSVNGAEIEGWCVVTSSFVTLVEGFEFVEDAEEYLKNMMLGVTVDKQIRKIEKEVKGSGKDLKKLEKADKKRDKVCEMGEKAMKMKNKAKKK
jgi:hypothetical protein